MVKAERLPTEKVQILHAPLELHKPPTDRKEPQVHQVLRLAADILWLMMWVFAVGLFFLGMLTEEKVLLALMTFVIIINIAGYSAFNHLWRNRG